MNLVIDIGNTRTKLAVFNNSEIELFKVFNKLTVSDLKAITKEYKIEKSILSSVTNHSSSIEMHLKKTTNFIELNNKIDLSIINKYNTPDTLGTDRLVNAVAATSIYPNSNTLIIDAGTCIKFDFVNTKNEYLGGSISPGIEMRFNALHDYTAKLPLYSIDKDYSKLIGSTTEESLKTGVLTAVIAEVEGLISQYQQKFSGLNILLTGGNTSFFEQNLKCSIFADENLLLKGLNKILLNA